MKEFISEGEWKQVIQLLGIENAQAVRIGPRERVVPGLESRWLMEVDSYVLGSAPPPGPYAVTTFYVPVMLPGDEARRQRRLTEGEQPEPGDAAQDGGWCALEESKLNI